MPASCPVDENTGGHCPIIVGSIRFDGGDEVGDPEQSLTDPPDAIGAEEQLGRVVHVAELHVICIGHQVDRNAGTVRYEELGPRALNGFYQPSA